MKRKDSKNLGSIKALIPVLRKYLFKRNDWQLIRYLQTDKVPDSPGKNFSAFLKHYQKTANQAESAQSNKSKKEISRIFHKLTRIVLLMNPKIFNSKRDQEIFYCYQQLLAGKILRHLYNPVLAEIFLEKAFRRAVDNDFKELKASSADYLSILAGIKGDLKLFNYYKWVCLQALNQLYAERTIFFHYHELVTYFSKKSNYTKAIKEKLVGYIEEAANIHEDSGTHVTNLYLVRLRSIYHELESEFETVIRLWEEFDDYLATYPEFASHDLKGESHLKKMGGCLNIMAPEKAEEFAEKALSELSPESLNWFYFNFYYLMMLFHTHQYGKIFETLEKVFKNPAYQKIPDNLQELFLFLNGFLEFIIESHLNPNFSARFSADRSQFRIQKLINQLPFYSRDKYGVNAVITLLDFLFKLNRNHFRELIGLEDTLNLYRKRYLKTKTNQKMTVFFKMLLTVIRKNFDPQKVEVATNDLYRELLNTKFQYEGGYEDLEIIPYEDLWDWILQKLRETS